MTTVEFLVNLSIMIYKTSVRDTVIKPFIILTEINYLPKAYCSVLSLSLS